MTLAGFYPWLKAMHVASALVFVGGMLAVGIVLASAPADPAAGAQTARAVRRWDQWVTTPAMLLVWALGLALALSAGWLDHAWLQAKLVFVLILSGLHGVQSGRLRRLAAGGGAGGKAPTLLVALVSILCISVLAVVKPGA